MTVHISLQLDEGTGSSLEALAKSYHLSAAELAKEAVEAYVAGENWQLAEVADSLRQVEQSDYVTHAAVADWLRSWGKPGEKPRPQ